MEKTAQTGVFYRISKDNNKVYYIKYLNEHKKQVLKKVGNHKDGIRIQYCANLRNEILTKIRLGESVPYIAKDKKLKFDDLANAYFESIKRKKATKYTKGKYNKVIKPFFGDKVATLINTTMLSKYVDYLYELDYANKTILNYFMLVKTIFNYAKKAKLFKEDIPFFELKIDIKNERDRYLTNKEIKQLLEKIKDDEIAYNFTVLALNLGARAESIINLKISDINFNNNTINLYDYKRKMRYTGYLNDFLIKHLKEFVSVEISPTTYLVNNSKTIIKYDNIRYKLVPVLDKLFNEDLDKNDRINRVVVHTFRHTFASSLAIANVPIFTIQKLLNHKKIDMTLRYAKLASENFETSVNKLYMG